MSKVLLFVFFFFLNIHGQNLLEILLSENSATMWMSRPQLAVENIPYLNQGQRAAFDEIVKAIDEQSGKTFFLHGPGGTEKTFTYNTLSYHFCSQGKIVLCVAGGRTAHSLLQNPFQNP